MRFFFFIPIYEVLTVDDDLFGTGVVNDKVKTRSARKADLEGHMSDFVAGAFFRFALDTRFRRRGEKKLESVGKLLDTLLYGHGETGYFK